MNNSFLVLFFKKGLLSFRSGEWLTVERLRSYGWLAVAFYVMAFVVAFATAHGVIDATGKPLGTDFSQIWVAGHSVLAGDPAAAYDPVRNVAAQHRLLGAFSGIYLWMYPPYFLAVAGFFALLPYFVGLAVWQIGTLVFYISVVRRILPGRLVLLGAVSFPGVFINLGYGQNGFLSAGLMSGAIVLLARRRALLGGVLFGLLAYKPQFGVLVPVALMAAGFWPAVFAAGATVAAMTVATLIFYGVGAWVAFWGALHFSAVRMLQNGNDIWAMMQSVFAVVRLWGAGVRLAYAAQVTLAVCVASLVGWLWRGRRDWRAKGAALLCGALLTTPYSFAYDLMLLSPALAMLVSLGLERGFLPWEKSLLAMVWVCPLFVGVGLARFGVPVGVLGVGLLFGLAFRSY